LGYKKKKERSYICKPGNEWLGEGCEEGSQVLWHDVHGKVVGPVAYDLAYFSRTTETADLIITPIPQRLILRMR